MSYCFKQLLGEGTTAKVYLVQDEQSGMYFAAKVSEDCEMLRKENHIMQAVGDKVFPKSIEYYEQETEGEIKGVLIMEYFKGGTLQQVLDRHGAFSVEEAIWIVQEILGHLQTLHEKNPPLVYRDIKPENIMFDKEGHIRLIDAASVICDKYRVGTYGYAAPEQFWENAKPGTACDIYAVGKVLAYLLTGKNPGRPPYDMLDYCRKDRRISTAVYHVLERSLAMEEMGRYASAKEFLEALEGILQQNRKRIRRFRRQKQKIIYEKNIHISEMQRIF